AVIASSGLNFDVIGIDERVILQELRMPELDLDSLPSSGNRTPDQPARTNTRRNQRNQRDQGGYGLEIPSYNPLLD
ncbi:MAG: hypothetical protein LBB98_10040, partial [Treponema sp.]|nr:hypothetical protein [Treponema sp.]